MTTVTLQIVEGVDKGRVFRELAMPLTIGREEGNLLRLNDERVSRFHAKIQQDNTDIILTDLESTNGTRVNGHVIQIRRLRLGDLIGVGRSVLLFGSNEQIAARLIAWEASTNPQAGSGLEQPAEMSATQRAPTFIGSLQQDIDFDVKANDEVTFADGNAFIGTRPLPPLPQKLSPAQAARLAEILDFLHRGMAEATANGEGHDEDGRTSLPFADWQKVLAVQMLLARYLRAIAEPDTPEA